MIAAWMLYATLVSGLLYGAGLVSERAPAALGRSRRWSWVAAIAGSVTLPLAVALRRGSFGATGGILPAEAAGAVRRTYEPIVAGGALAPENFAVLDALLLGGWIVASVALLVLLVRGHLALNRARAGWTAAGPGELNVTRDELRVLVAGAPVRITDGQGPAVTEALQSEILLPRWCLDLPSAERALVLAHEGEHIRGGDPWLLLATRLAAIAFPWLLPLWWQLRRLRLAVELDCDARVLRRGFAAPTYGRLLLEVGSRQSNHGDHARAIAALAAPSSQLERRIRAMLTSSPRARWVRAVTAVVVATGLVVVACESPTPFEAQTGADTPAVAEVTEQEAPKVRLWDHDLKLGASEREIEGSLRRLYPTANDFTLREKQPGGAGEEEVPVSYFRQSGEPSARVLLRELELRAQAGQAAPRGVQRKVGGADGTKAEFPLREQP